MIREKRLWPGYVHPQSDELFSSWLMRTCKSHEYKSHSFAKFYFNGTALWNRDIDREGSPLLKECITDHTFLSVSDVEQLFLKSLEGNLISQVIANGPCRSILPLGVRHRTRFLYGQMYCPGCLDNEIPYYQKSWRLAFNIVCLRCQLQLCDRCPKCTAPVAFHRLENGQKNRFLSRSMSECFHCSFDLRYAGVVVNNPEIINYQRFIDDFAMAKSRPDGSLSPELYLKLLTLISLPRGGTSRFQKAFTSEFNMTKIPSDPYSNIITRQQLLPQIFMRLNSVESIRDFLLKHNLRKSDLSRVLGADDVYSYL